jgi:hypothetical protein
MALDVDIRRAQTATVTGLWLACTRITVFGFI